MTDLAVHTLRLLRYEGRVYAGDHRYQFTVYAMPIEELPAQGSVSPAMLRLFGKNIAPGAAELTVTYGRQIAGPGQRAAFRHLPRAIGRTSDPKTARPMQVSISRQFSRSLHQPHHGRP